MYKESSENLNHRIVELEKELAQLKKLRERQSNSIENLVQNFNKNSLLSVIDPNFTLIEVNDNRLQQLGVEREEVLGGKCHKVFYNLDKTCEECTVNEVIESKQTSKFLKSYNHNGTIRFEEKSVSPILSDVGEIERLVIETEDISSYYNLVDKVGQREEFFKNIFESAGDAFLVHDEKGNILEFGSQLPKLLEYSPSELKNLTINDIDDPTKSLGFENRQKQFEDQDCLLFETEIIKKSGKRVPVEISASLIPIEGHRLFFVSLRNVEKRKKAEENLRLSVKTFQTLVENAPDLIMRFDREFKHLFVNSAAKTILGISPKEFIGKTHEEMGFPKEHCDFWADEMEKVFSSSKSTTVEFTLKIEEEEHYFEWQLIPEFESDGETVTLMAVARDITNQKLNEKALKEAIQTKDKFFSIIAHDLKNPFNVMLPMAESLKDNLHTLDKEQLTEMVDLINSAVRQEYNLLENLLEWSRAQTGSIKLKPRKIDLKRLTELNLNLNNAKTQSKNISVEFIPDIDNIAFADEYMVDTVIRNLISNALKFTHPKGKMKINIVSKETKIYFHIEDNGIGISSENQEKLFRIDTNFNRAGTNEELGTGIGLILCKEFIEQNEGKICVESEVGKGSKFSFSLPI